ncbi:MAG: multi-sensor hybrid histidine kinase [Polaromonas sp.]|nr:multi-sensor hybrid histidine kinase [Polaromonas sp.]
MKPALPDPSLAALGETFVPLESIVCTQELHRRPARAPDYAMENPALLALAQALVDSPRTIFQALGDTVLALLKADSAGLSLLTPDETRFHWPAVSGMWRARTGGGTLRGFGPSGDVLDCNAPLLFRRFERRYCYLRGAAPLAEECLMAPFYMQGKAVGTIWAIAHDARRQFDTEDLRQLTSLAKFASVAHQATQALDAEKEFSRSIIDSSPDCIKILDLKGNLLSVLNGQALLGIEDIGPFLNKPWIVFWQGGDRQSAQAAVEAAAAGQQGRFVGFFRTMCGEPKWWDVAISPILDANGKPGRLLAVSRDVTDRMRAEQTARHNEERFRALFKLGPLAMYSCDVQGTVQEYNDAAVQLWGRAPRRGDTNEKFCGSYKLHLADGTSLPHAQTPVAAVLRGEIPAAHDVKVIIERPDGSRINVIANMVPIKNANGDITGVINCLYDTTERTRLEHKTQEQAATLGELDRRKDEFLAMLSHELRNPLAPISNALKILQLQKNEDPVQQQACRIIERQVGNLTHLVDDLLEVSRISTGRVQLRRERMAVSDVVDRAVETASVLIAQRRHELTLSVPAQPLWLHADAARLEQVVVNLLTNAAKYTDAGGHLWLSVEQEADEAVLRVRDTGVGIPAELLPRIFDMFTQADRSLDRSQGGLGIGLCLVQRLVELHGGSVQAASVLGQGSEFVVRLPLMQVGMAPPPLLPASTALRPGTSRRVLVVDDNADAAETLAMLLEASGHEARMAYDGPGAVQAALDFCPDMAVVDIGLPGFSGLEVARRIRKLAALEGIVLVAMTGYGQATDLAHTQEAGFDHHLVKPADFKQVQKILDELARSMACRIDQKAM